MELDGAGALLAGPAASAVVSAAVLWKLAALDVNRVSFATAVLGMTLVLSIIALVPYDVSLAVSSSQEQRDAWEEHLRLVRDAWRTLYWTTAVLCWFLIPVLIEFERAGELSARDRLRTSLRRNVRCYIVQVLVIIALVMAGMLGGLVGRNYGPLGSWIIAISYTWGVLRLAVTMSFGFVAVPRRLWHLSDPGMQLRELYGQACAVDEARLSALYELQDTVSSARAEYSAHTAARDGASFGGGPALDQFERAVFAVERLLFQCDTLCQQLAGVSQASESTKRSKAPSSARTPTGLASSLEQRVAALVRTQGFLRDAAMSSRRALFRWEELLHKCRLFGELDSHAFGSAAEIAVPSVAGKGVCCRRFALIWFRLLRRRVYQVLACFSAALSIIVAIAQLLMPCRSGCWCGTLSILFCQRHSPRLTQAMCALPLGYMVFTTFWSIFKLKIMAWRGLYWNHNTDTVSLLWYASQLAGLATPLGYHFLLLSRVRHTQFEDFMGQMQDVPVLGMELFIKGFPVLVGLLCLCNIFDVYSRAVRCLGLSFLEFDGENGGESGDTGPVVEGRRLVEREWERQRQNNGEGDLPPKSGSPNANDSRGSKKGGGLQLELGESASQPRIRKTEADGHSPKQLDRRLMADP